MPAGCFLTLQKSVSEILPQKNKRKQTFWVSVAFSRFGLVQGRLCQQVAGGPDDSGALGRAGRDSQHFKSLRRGVLRTFWGLKTENGCFFGQKFFSTRISLFSLDFLKRHFPARTGADQGGELPRLCSD